MRSFASFDGCRIAFVDRGEGPAVVLVHGYTGNVTHWDDSLVPSALLSAGHRVVMLDLRGHGESDAPAELAAYEDRALARDVVALADHLCLDSYHLVGYSLGAIVAGTVAQLDGRIHRLVLGGIGASVMDPDWERPRALVRALLDGDDGGSADPLVSAIDSILDERGGNRRALAGVQHGHVPLRAEDLATVTIPTLVLCGVDDDLNGRPEPLANALPMGRLEWLPGDHRGALFTPEHAAALCAFLGGDAAEPAA